MEGLGFEPQAFTASLLGRVDLYREDQLKEQAFPGIHSRSGVHYEAHVTQDQAYQFWVT